MYNKMPCPTKKDDCQKDRNCVWIVNKGCRVNKASTPTASAASKTKKPAKKAALRPKPKKTESKKYSLVKLNDKLLAYLLAAYNKKGLSYEIKNKKKLKEVIELAVFYKTTPDMFDRVNLPAHLVSIQEDVKAYNNSQRSSLGNIGLIEDNILPFLKDALFAYTFDI